MAADPAGGEPGRLDPVGVGVRQTLRCAEREVSNADPERRFAAIRTAVRHEHPAPDIDQMLDEIEQGYEQDAG